MSTTAVRVPDGVAEDVERYIVHDKREIVSILRSLQSRRAQVTLSWGGEEFALTVLLAVNPEYEEMVFDCGSDPEANRALVGAERIELVANMDGIRVQFSARHADPTVFEGHPALRVRLPALLLRLQRRDSYRVAASLVCHVTIESDGGVRALELRVADLSLSGLALVCDKSFVQLECGQLLENARIDLGAAGTLVVTLEVRNLSETTTRSGLRQLRAGCQFTEVSRSMETQISRFIGQKERERLTRS